MKDVIVGRHFEVMKDGAIVCNTGHYDCEINLEELEAMAASKRAIRANCEEYTMADGRRIYAQYLRPQLRQFSLDLIPWGRIFACRRGHGVRQRSFVDLPVRG